MTTTPTPQGTPIEPEIVLPELPDVEELAHEIAEECLGFGLSAESIARYLRSYEKKVIAAILADRSRRLAGVAEPVAYQYWTIGEFWRETSRLGYEARRDAGDKVRALYAATVTDAPAPAQPAAQAASTPVADPYFGIDDEVALTRAVSVMNDVLTDTAGWEDQALSEAVNSSKTDLCAVIECIRMRADGNYVPGSKPIDGEVA